jgi:competence protein ComEA
MSQSTVLATTTQEAEPLRSRLRSAGHSIMLLMALCWVAVSGTQAWADDSTVNINTAPAEELSAVLSGVGLAKARRIIEYREAHGPFEHVDELAEVTGIGIGTVEKNRTRIHLE